jgi:hypothetical protein
LFPRALGFCIHPLTQARTHTHRQTCGGVEWGLLFGYPHILPTHWSLYPPADTSTHAHMYVMHYCVRVRKNYHCQLSILFEAMRRSREHLRKSQRVLGKETAKSREKNNEGSFVPGVRPRCQLSQYPLRPKSCEYVYLISCAALVVAGPSSMLYVCVPHRPADPSLRGIVRAGSLCSNSRGRCVSRPAREMRRKGVASCAAYMRYSMRWGISGYACMWRGGGEGKGAASHFA